MVLASTNSLKGSNISLLLTQQKPGAVESATRLACATAATRATLRISKTQLGTFRNSAGLQHTHARLRHTVDTVLLVDNITINAMSLAVTCDCTYTAVMHVAQ